MLIARIKAVMFDLQKSAVVRSSQSLFGMAMAMTGQKFLIYVTVTVTVSQISYHGPPATVAV